mmetsp:Transcript_1792/g.4146  ORF Transcript_1792/g.4146 Transcript_1792/m.4146 type:complete len:205 (-) Transcript_1792:1512-2126(-)
MPPFPPTKSTPPPPSSPSTPPTTNATRNGPPTAPARPTLPPAIPAPLPASPGRRWETAIPPSIPPPSPTLPPSLPPFLPPSLPTATSTPDVPLPTPPTSPFYWGGDLVSHEGLVNQCWGLNGTATGNRCAASSEYSPGVGKYWPTAWERLGTCRGSLAPTAAPTRDEANDIGGCPPLFSKDAAYGPGDEVSRKEGYAYRCKRYP